jgi:hypothetical protein
MAANADVINLDSDEEGEGVVKRARLDPGQSSGQGAGCQFDLTGDDDEPADSAPVDVASSSGPYVTIDLCEDEDEGGAALAKQLNLLFDNEVELVGFSSGGGGSSSGSGRGSAFASSSWSPIELDGEIGSDTDAAMAARLQAKLDAEEQADEEARMTAEDRDAAFARRVQQRLARELAQSEEQADMPVDVLHAQRQK